FDISFCNISSSFFFSSRRRHTRSTRDWSSDVCSSDLVVKTLVSGAATVNAEPGGTTTFDQSTPVRVAVGCGASKRSERGAHPERSEERRVGKECRRRGAAYGQSKT